MSIGRNDPCPCGSGKKYKKCCLVKALFSEAPGLNTPKHFIKCEYLFCDVNVPQNLISGADNFPEQFCGSGYCTDPDTNIKWALCPKHAKEWRLFGHHCESLQHYREWEADNFYHDYLEKNPTHLLCPTQTVHPL